MQKPVKQPVVQKRPHDREQLDPGKELDPKNADHRQPGTGSGTAMLESNEGTDLGVSAFKYPLDSFLSYS
jgi:hypothetical protein